MTAPDVEQLVDGRYARREQLGRGGFGVVWRAHDTLLQRDVAIKEVEFPSFLEEHEQAALREKVLREARAAARLSHPALVTVFDVVEEDGRPLIVMELVNAPTLAERVAVDGPLSDAEAAAIGTEILDALTTAHGQGIIHRDVKPANVMVSDNGRVQLGDFGIASVIDDPKVTSSGRLAGSPSYMAPEQAHNQPAGPATDLWGLGATLYFAVEGEPPFEKEGAIPTLTSVVGDDPRPMGRATALAPLLHDLLSKDPQARPPVADVRRRLADVSAGRAPVETVPPITMELDPATLQEATETAPMADGVSAEPLPPPFLPPPPPPSPPPPSPSPPPPPPAPPATAAVRPAPAPPDSPRRSSPIPSSSARTGRPSLALLALVILLIGAVIAVLVARVDDPPSSTVTEEPTPTETTAATEATSVQAPASSAPARAAGVPRNWVSYQDPATGFTLSHPPNWSIERNGSLTDFRDPSSGAYLRVDYTRSPGPSAEQAWYDFEPTFAAENPNYRRVQITPTTFKGFPAAVWEFTYTGRGAQLRAIDLGFVTGTYGFALNFQAPAGAWQDMQDEFEAFKTSFQPPRG